jgi:hypothetical protein
LRAYAATTVPPDATLPLGLIQDAVRAAGCTEQRRRLLPAVAVVVFVLGCALFHGESYGEVAAKLAGWLSPLAGPGGWHLPGTGALARARRRAGPAPLRMLFTALAGPLASADTPGAWAFGRLLTALDGTIVDVPYSPPNLAAFGAPPSGSGGGGAWPQVRLVTVIACGTRGIIDAAFRGRRAARASEQDLARVLAARGRLGPGMLVLADRNFSGYPVAAVLAATGADLLIRVKSSQWLPVLDILPDGSARSVLPTRPAGQRAADGRRRGRPLCGPPAGLPVRLINAALTITAAGEPPRTEQCRLITTLTDPAQAPAADLAACYAQRWEIETSYRDLKTSTRGPRQVLRSRHPAGIAQEIWALLCACQLTHAARTHAAHLAGLDPDRISYTITLRALRRTLITGTATTTAEALATLLPPRRQRHYPRLTRTSTTKRRAARASHTSATTTITITSPATGPPSP